MTIAQVAYYRLHSQQLSHHAFTHVGDMVKHMGVLQAQDYGGAKWSVGVRIPNLTDADVEVAIADKTIVRSWSLRGTLHFMAAEDVRWITQLVAPRVLTVAGTNHRKEGLDGKIFNTAHKVLTKALQGHTVMTRQELTNFFYTKRHTC